MHLHNCCLRKLLKERSDALCQLDNGQKEMIATQDELKACERRVHNLQSDLNEKEVKIENLTKHQAVKTAEVRAMTVELETKLRHSQDATEASGKELQRLKANIEEKGKVVVDLNTERSQLMTKCQKLEAQLAKTEKKTAKESLTSGSYADDHANPSMLEVACKAVDKAIEALATSLHDNSVTKSCPLNSEYLEHVVGNISPAHPAQFSRPIQVKHAWGHWIGLKMFRCFEHVFLTEMTSGSLPRPWIQKVMLCYASKGFST